MGGRKPALTGTKAAALALYRDGKTPVKDVCATLGVSRSAFYRFLERQDARENGRAGTSY